MIILDLFCGAGGSAKGYADAGWEVVGIDINPQPSYPYQLIITHAFNLDRILPFYKIDAIHASPPCQAFTAYKRTGKVKDDHLNLIPQTRDLLKQTGLPYIIENVKGAPLEDPIMLCGSMFGLDVQRHRYFETNFDVPQLKCNHSIWEPNRFPGGRSIERTGSNTGLSRNTCEIGSWDTPVKVQREAIGIDWMNIRELSQAIPPAYTEYIGKHIS